jgi:DeoR family transcriptional regulator, suf operon transcriptional repressor
LSSYDDQQRIARMSDARPRDTRGRLLGLLCGADRTAAELAGELRISARTVRGHLRLLEEEGIVAHRVVRRDAGKPAHEYYLTPLGSTRLSRAYLPLLAALLEVVHDRAGDVEEEALLREAGRALARRFPRPGGALGKRVAAAVELLGEMGGVSWVRVEDDVLWIHGACCPLRGLVSSRPAACKSVEALLTDFIGAPVREHCVRGDAPACRFVVSQPR